MSSPLEFFGLEIVSWPALFLLVFVVLGVWGVDSKRAINKAWEGGAQATFSTRFRTHFPRLLTLLGVLAIVCALADVTRKYVVTSEVFSVNRLIVTLDNSSSMYNFQGGTTPIFCTDRELKVAYPRIWNACRAMEQLVSGVEAYAKKKGEDRQDKIAILRFGLNSFVEMYPTSDYERARRVMKQMNWRDPRTGVFTEVHLALWDMYQIALQRNFRGAKDNTLLSEGDRLLLAKALRPEGFTVPFHPPRAIEQKLIALRKDLRDTALIIISDAQEGQFEVRLNKDPVSFIKMMQLAKFLEVPVHIISIYNDHELVRGLAADTGYGEAGGPNRGAFHLLRGEKDYTHMDEIVSKILSTRFRPDSQKQDVFRESYAPALALAGLVLIALGTLLANSRFGRVLTQHHGGKK